MTLATVSLDDKYALESGRVYLSGVQALVRLPMMQRQRDAVARRSRGAVRDEHEARRCHRRCHGKYIVRRHQPAELPAQEPSPNFRPDFLIEV